MRRARAIISCWLVFSITSISSAPALAALLERGPYLQQATSNSITVRWRTDTATDAVVRFGTSPGVLNRVAVGNQSGTDHEVIVTGLTPGTLYYYSVGDSGEVLAGGDPPFTFRASPSLGSRDNTRVWVIGDSGTADSDARSVRDAYLSFSGNRPADLWLMLGDNAYADGTDAEYQDAVFDMYPTVLRKTPLWTTLGNHDGHSANSANEQGPYYTIFTMPKNAEAGGIASGTEAYYSFDYGNIHFISLDSYDTDLSLGGAMLTWLENDLATTNQDWLIAFWHHPPYSKGSHDSDSEGRLMDMRERVLPILESYGVDLVLSGHSHSYERSFLIDGHYGTSDTFSSSMLIDNGSGREDGSGAYAKISPGNPNQGTVYAVAGSSGKTSSGPLDHPVMFFSLRSLGSMILDINGDRLDAAFVDSDGVREDYFTMRKGAIGGDSEAPSPVSNLAATNITSTSLALNWQAATDNVGVTGYRVSRNGSVVANANVLTFNDSNLTPNTAYMYSVVALDAAGNESALVLVTATTQRVSNNDPVSGGGAIGVPSLFVVVALLILLRLRELRAQLRILCTALLLGTPLLAVSHEDIDLQLATVNAQLAEYPEDYRLHAKRGELHGLHNDWQLALISLRRAQSLAPDAIAAILDLRIGETHYLSGNPDKALPYVDRYLSTHSESSTGWRVHAKIEGSMNETDAALESIERSIRYADAPTPELFFERARLLEHQPHRADELLAGIDEGVQTLGPLMAFLEYAIDIELQRENYVGAIARIEALPEPIRTQPRWLLRRSMALNEFGNLAEAKSVNRLALQAIENLPARRRHTEVYIALRSEIEKSYDRMRAD